MLSSVKHENSGDSIQKNRLRLWPGVSLLALQWLVRFIFPIISPRATAIAVFGGMVCGLAIIVWWAFFSRAARIERWGAIVLMVLALSGTSLLLDESIATANMGMMFIIFSIPVMCLAFVIWAVATRNLSSMARRITMVITIFLAAGVWIFLRTDGMYGDARQLLKWRWAKTHEEKLLAQKEIDAVPYLPDTTSTDLKTEWPGFRGANRNGVVYGVQISSDWFASPPVELWRWPIGPGCSSFAVHGNLLYTQEQLGEYEAVSCYNLTNGKPVWKHQDKARFYDSHAGAGPRSTPSLAGGRVYTLGATGILNALDAKDGSLIWSRNAASDAGIKVRTWGISASPLVFGDVVIVALTGKLAAFDISTGNPRWFGTDGGSGYSSPHLMTLSNLPQILLMSEAGVVSVDPVSGEKLWDYSWPLPDRVLQPAWLGNNDILLTEEYKNIRRLTVTKKIDSWEIKELWTSSEIKMLFNDLVIHNGYAYGFDGPSMACIDLKDGKRMWRGARYRGFQILLADQDLILVLSEKGELALVSADPGRFTEIARIQALNGKTWNHPALAGNILIVRNAEEMAAFRLEPE